MAAGLVEAAEGLSVEAVDLTVEAAEAVAAFDQVEMTGIQAEVFFDLAKVDHAPVVADSPTVEAVD